jgi:multiple sugar transport system ATP-binding protein
VTHDQVEAMTLGSRICIMNGGKVAQIGQPLEVYRKPANTFVASFLGNPPMNLLKAVVTDHPSGRGIRIGACSLVVAADRMPPRAPGSEIIFGIRPENVSAQPRNEEADVEVEIVQVEPLGAETVFAGRITGVEKPIFARVGPQIEFSVGERRRLALDLASAHVFDAEGVALHS